jgi:hypothetical protein
MGFGLLHQFISGSFISDDLTHIYRS